MSTAPEQKKKLGKAQIFLLVVIGICILVFAMGSRETAIQDTKTQIENKVVNDAIKRYETASSTGDKIQMAAYAGMVRAAYIHINDVENTQKWDKITKDLEAEARASR